MSAAVAEPSDPSPIATLADRISITMKREVGLRPEVELVEPGSLPRFELKAARFHDERSS